MTVFDLGPLKKNENEYDNLVSAVTEQYRGDWDDPVHESYVMYVKQVQERCRVIREICCKAEDLAIEVGKLEIKELTKKAESLCREADMV